MRGWAWLLHFACFVTLVASVDQWFLNLFIPLSCVVFSAIPPVILVPCFWIFAPDAYEELQIAIKPIEAKVSSSISVEIGGGAATSKPLVQPTKRGCACVFPFTFGGHTHKSCTRVQGTFLAGEPEKALWCDTGPDCGMKYTADDRPYTSRECCYDVCVNKAGRTLEGNAMPDRN
jgi:hypothetical protein